MQCLRDAKAEFDKSTALAKAQYKASPAKPGACPDCGKVTRWWSAKRPAKAARWA
jgi:hypothetical protein